MPSISSGPPKLVLVGGFLGAGKTTLIAAAAARLRDAGQRVGIVANDQGGELVDAHALAASGFAVEQVAGGCFCCRLSDFLAAAGRMEADVLLAEPVGSCTDLVATIYRPLAERFPGRYSLAPLTVLVDPARAAELLGPAADPMEAYLFRQQIAEADGVWFSKADRADSIPAITGVDGRRLSARTGEGIDDWLAWVRGDERRPGLRTLDIDYAEYAAAEAALGWMNWRGTVQLANPLRPPELAGRLIESVEADLTGRGAAIAHLKVFVSSPEGWVKASICGDGAGPQIDGELDAAPAAHCDVVLNLRAVAAPDWLTAAARDARAGIPGDWTQQHAEAFRPAAPRPEIRLP